MKNIQRFKLRSFILCAALLASFGIGVPYASAQQGSYLIDLNNKTATMLDMDSLVALNDSGQVAGSFYSNSFITGPNGVGMSELGTLGGDYSYATDINNAGQVVGYALAPGYHSNHAFITGPNGVGMTDLGTLGGDTSIAYHINDTGQVVGTSMTSNGAVHAFITGPNGVGMTDLGFEVAFGINDAGQAVGYSFTPDSARRAFITGPNGVGVTDLGTLGGDTSVATGINDAGQVVGSSSTPDGASHAFITGPNGVGMTDLGFEGIAYSINDAGQVVGSSTTPEGAHAFMTGPNGVGVVDLNSTVDLPKGAFLTEAVDINNVGRVLAMGVIPEPETYALLLSGLGLVGFMARRRKKKDTGLG